jgi:hypothetical protein
VRRASDLRRLLERLLRRHGRRGLLLGHAVRRELLLELELRRLQRHLLRRRQQLLRRSTLRSQRVHDVDVRVLRLLLGLQLRRLLVLRFVMLTPRPELSALRRPVARTLVACALAAVLALATREANAQVPGGLGCADGKVKNADTAGHCCWEGQVWAQGKCIGPPRACPKGWSIDRSRDACALDACPHGMVRPPNARTECCWPGQAWSRINGVCVGAPRCPKDFELRGDTCADLEAERAERIRAAEIAAQREREERERAERQRREYEEEMRRQHELQAEQERKARAEQAERERGEAERRRIAEEEQRRREHEARVAEARASARSKRDAGKVTLGFGVTAVAVSGVFIGLGAQENAIIRRGGFASASDIQSEASQGKAFNITAAVCGAVGGALVAIGIPVIAVNRDPNEADIARRAPAPRLAITVDAAGGGLRGAF